MQFFEKHDCENHGRASGVALLGEMVAAGGAGEVAARRVIVRLHPAPPRGSSAGLHPLWIGPYARAAEGGNAFSKSFPNLLHYHYLTTGRDLLPVYLLPRPIVLMSSMGEGRRGARELKTH